MAAAPMWGRPFVALFESRIGSVGLSDVGAAIGAVSLRVSRIGLVAKPGPWPSCGAAVSLRSCGLVAWRSPNRP